MAAPTENSGEQKWHDKARGGGGNTKTRIEAAKRDQRRQNEDKSNKVRRGDVSNEERRGGRAKEEAGKVYN